MHTLEKVLAGMVVVVVILTLTMPIAYAIGLGEQRAESSYTGVVTDVEVDKGIVLRTTQVRMKTDAESSNFEEFCVHPSNEGEFVPKFRNLASNQTRVTVTYSRPLFVPLWDCQQGLAIVRDVEKYNGE